MRVTLEASLFVSFIVSKKFHDPTTSTITLPTFNSYFVPCFVPSTVITELEGLSRGIRSSPSTNIVVETPLSHQLAQQTSQITSSRPGNRNDPQHAAFVAQASKDALAFLKSKNPAIK